MTLQLDKFALGIVVSLLAVASFAQKPNLPNDTTASGDIIFTEIATPLSNPASGKSRFYVDSTLHLPCSMSATGVVTCVPASQSVTINTTSPLGGGGALSLGGTLTLTCATCNTSSATVTSFSAGTLSPLFTTSVATATTTPALTFALSNAAANTVFGNFTGSSGAPSYNALSPCGDSTHALAWTAGTGFTCQAISAGSGTVSNIATTSPITGGPITTTGTIACATCAIGPGSSTANHLAKFSGTDGVTLADGGAIPAGTVTSIATTSPIGGGTITGSGTLTCTTCVTSAAALTSGQLVAGAGSQAAAVTNLTGDVTTSGGVATTLASVVAASSCGDTTHSCGLTYDAKGRITAATNNVISGGGSSFPLTIVQAGGFQSGGPNTTSFAVTFPQATAASGNTAFMLLAGDGSSAVTAPAGWTVDINQSQASFARFMLVHKTTASDTSATWTVASASSFAVYFFEVTGAHALDQSSTGGIANSQFVILPAITPTANSVVFGMAALVGAGSIAVTVLPAMGGAWSDIGFGAPLNGGRALIGHMSNVAATHVSTTPPLLSIPVESLFASGGIAYATFSIL